MHSLLNYYSLFEKKLLMLVGALLMLFIWLTPVVDGVISRIPLLILILSLFLLRNARDIMASDFKWIILANLAYVATAFLSLLNNQDWGEAGGRLEKYIPFLLTLLMMSGFMLEKRTLYKFFFSGALLGSFAVGCVAIYMNGYHGLDRLGGGWAGLNVNAFGHISSLLVIVLTSAVCFDIDIVRKRLALLASIFAVAAVIASGSRGSLMAMLSGLAVIFIFSLYVSDSKQRKHMLLAMFAILVSSLGIVMLSSDWQMYLDKMVSNIQSYSSGAEQYSSISARFLMWEAGIKSGLANFWLGTGVGDTELDYKHWESIGAIPSYGHSMFVVHNIFIDCFATTGALGLLAMLAAVFIIPAKIFVKNLVLQKEDWLVVTASIAGLAVLMDNFMYGLTHSWLYIRVLPYPFILMIVLLLLSSRNRIQE